MHLDVKKDPEMKWNRINLLTVYKACFNLGNEILHAVIVFVGDNYKDNLLLRMGVVVKLLLL